jgi:hypothetical protein
MVLISFPIILLPDKICGGETLFIGHARQKREFSHIGLQYFVFQSGILFLFFHFPIKNKSILDSENASKKRAQ